MGLMAEAENFRLRRRRKVRESFCSAFAAADDADEDALALETVGFDVGVTRVGGAEDGAAFFYDIAF